LLSSLQTLSKLFSYWLLYTRMKMKWGRVTSFSSYPTNHDTRISLLFFFITQHKRNSWEVVFVHFGPPTLNLHHHLQTTATWTRCAWTLSKCEQWAMVMEPIVWSLSSWRACELWLKCCLQLYTEIPAMLEHEKSQKNLIFFIFY
jgi:hypothetical protein